MKRILYPECAAGLSGDMAVAALLDLGASEERLRGILGTIPLEEPVEIRISRVKKSGLDVCDFDVVLPEEIDPHDHDMEYLHGSGAAAVPHGGAKERGPKELRRLYEASEMSAAAKETAGRILDILAAAEAKAHGVALEQVHFHEVGAADSVIDIAAFAVCYEEICERYGIKETVVTGLTEGCGTVRCRHGVLPVPVPAVVNIAEAYGLPLRLTKTEGELVTPTGAAIAAALSDGASLPETCRVVAAGLGAGKRDYPTAGFLRIMVLEA